MCLKSRGNLINLLQLKNKDHGTDTWVLRHTAII